ncbi:hypothetical protein [Diaphorobacter sp.]|uniref:hypothetical protein n=1 Tax=Diaphorobacter sp. TaxID=1934310 RepID=UPI003D132FEC
MALMPPPPLLRRRLALAWLLLALALAPTLGRMHQVLHLPGGQWQANAWAHGLEEHGAGVGHHVLDTLHALFASHGTADCQTLDQQTLVGVAPGHAHALGLQPLRTLFFKALARAPFMREAASFHARAPPLSA